MLRFAFAKMGRFENSRQLYRSLPELVVIISRVGGVDDSDNDSIRGSLILAGESDLTHAVLEFISHSLRKRKYKIKYNPIALLQHMHPETRYDRARTSCRLEDLSDLSESPRLARISTSVRPWRVFANSLAEPCPALPLCL